MSRRIQRYGWTRDLPDYRDVRWSSNNLSLSRLPPVVDLRPQMPPIYDQGELGSCTANAIAAALQFDDLRQQLPDTTTPSRLFIYYNERVEEGSPNSDSGAQLRDGAKVVATKGWCNETEWPYDISKFTVKPSDDLYKLALDHKALVYLSVRQRALDIQSVLAEGFPVVFGFTVYQSFESDYVTKTGFVPMPSPADEDWGPIGGHAVVLVGYDTTMSEPHHTMFIVRNSWGSGWGAQGYFYMPFQYVTDPDLCADFWTYRSVS